jgi:tRNA A37 N6-isopentenylltransferase MiaA
MIAKLEHEIQQYTKRQLTWFKRNESILWLDVPKASKVFANVKNFLLTKSIKE